MKHLRNVFSNKQITNKRKKKNKDSWFKDRIRSWEKKDREKNLNEIKVNYNGTYENDDGRFKIHVEFNMITF